MPSSKGITKKSISNTKICASRKTKDYPNVYTTLELKKLAIDQGHDRKVVRSMTDKKELCNLLNIEWNRVTGKVTPKKKSLSPKKKESFVLEVKEWKGRSCSQNPSKLNPNAYTKEELIKLAVKRIKNVNKTDIAKLKKTEICGLLQKHKKKKNVKSPKKSVKSPKKSVKSPKKSVKSPKKSVKSPKKSVKSPKKSLNKSPKARSVGKSGDCVQRSKLKLRKHQVEVVDYLRDHRGLVAAFDVGTGKTLTAVTASQCFLDTNSKGKVIVVTPKSLQKNFKKEMIAYGIDSEDPRYSFFTIRKFTTTYSEKSFPKNTFLIIDEAHNLRTSSAESSRVAVSCGQKAEKVLLLTATPLYNSPHDLIPLVAIVKGEKVMSDKKFDAMSDKQLCDYFRDVFIFFKNPKSCDYPTVREHEVKIPMTKKYYKEYRKVETKNSHLWQDKNPWTFLTGVRQATNAVEPHLKAEWTVNKVLEGKKTLIFSSFLTHGVRIIQKMLDDEKVPWVEVTGKLTTEERDKAVKKYNSNKVRVMFVTKAGGEGLDLKGTRNVIFEEKTWNRPNEEQVMGRAARYKSHCSPLPKDERYVDVYHLLITKPDITQRDSRDNKESADEMLNEIVKKKFEANAKFEALLQTVAINAEEKDKCPPQGFEFIRKGYEGEFEVSIIDLRSKSSRNKTKNAKERVIQIIGKQYPESVVVYNHTTERTTVKFMVTTKKHAEMYAKRVSRIFIGTNVKEIDGKWKNNDKEYIFTIPSMFK